MPACTRLNCSVIRMAWPTGSPASPDSLRARSPRRSRSLADLNTPESEPPRAGEPNPRSLRTAPKERVTKVRRATTPPPPGSDPIVPVTAVAVEGHPEGPEQLARVAAATRAGGERVVGEGLMDVDGVAALSAAVRVGGHPALSGRERRA